MIAVQYDAPSALLAKLVSSFYRLDFDGDHFSEIERADRAQFRFQLRGEGEYHFASGQVAPTYPATIIGPTSAPVRAVASCPLTIFGWGMSPEGWVALMGKESADFVDRAIDARELFGDSIMVLRDKLVQANDFSEQCVIGNNFATDIYSHGETPAFEFTTKVDQWLVEQIDPDVEELIKSTGLSPRQLERITKRYYGMPPKKLARKYRALRAAHALARGDSLDDTDLGLAFYDQSHLIRELKAFTGLTPSQLKSGQSELTQVTMDGRRSLGGRVSALISDS